MMDISQKFLRGKLKCDRVKQQEQTFLNLDQVSCTYLIVYDVIVKKFTFSVSSCDELVVSSGIGV